VTIDRPLFITGDEPVILEMPDGVSHVQHLPTCSPPDRRGVRSSRRRGNLAYGDTVHSYPNRPGVEQAAEVAIPLTPQALLVLGTKAEPQGTPHYHPAGADAMSPADKVNGRVLAYAYQWVAAHPEHPSFAGMVFPDLEPVIRVCDGGSQFAHDLDRPPDPRQPQLLGRPGSYADLWKSSSCAPGARAAGAGRHGPEPSFWGYFRRPAGHPNAAEWGSRGTARLDALPSMLQVVAPVRPP
jgi:Protein of unknown function (DUF4238)